MIERDGNRLILSRHPYPLIVSRLTHAQGVERHTHDFYEMVYIERGFAIHTIRRETTLFLAGDVFIIPPGVPHEFRKTVNNQVYNCAFAPALFQNDWNVLQNQPLLKQASEETGDLAKIHLPLNARAETESLLRRLCIETGRTPPGYELCSRSLLTGLLILLARFWEGAVPMEGCSSVAEAGRVAAALDYFDAHPENAGDIAGMFGYSRERFSRIFKKYTGITPSAYITTSRIAKAAERLLDPAVSISGAAEAAGFDDINYFSRLFKKETGQTPTQFRHQSGL